MASCEAAIEEGTQDRFYEKTSSLYSLHELYAVAEYMNQDPDLWVFRRFSRLQILNLLSIQQRLSSFEGEFQRRISADIRISCENLMPDIQDTLREYNDALAAQARSRSYLKPEAHVLKHMKKWSHMHESALRAGLNMHEQGNAVKDLAAIAATEKSWTHRFIDSHGRLRGLFAKEVAAGADDQLSSTLIYSEESVRRAEAVFVHVSFCVVLLCPITALLYVDSKIWKLVLLALFLLVVSVLSVGLLNAPNKAGLALVAGYAAILVVFLSNNIGS